MSAIRGIYKITNVINYKIYIGQTSDMETRWYNHIYELNHNAHRNTHLQNAWNKYGEKSFEFSVLRECIDSDDLNNLERNYIKEYKSNDQSVGYNLTSGGEGYKLNEEIKRKISIAKRGHQASLSVDDVRKIKLLMYCNMDRKEIAQIFNTNAKVLTCISMGETYSYVAPELNNEIHNLKQKLIDQRNQDILKLYDEGFSIGEITKIKNYTRSVVEKCIYKYRKVDKNYKIRKLSCEQENEVVEKYLKQKVSSTTLSQEYNVSSTTIMNIINIYKISEIS